MQPRTDPPYRALREAAGLSQRAVERGLGWKSGRLSTLERGLRPTEAEHAALVRYLVNLLSETTGGDAA